MPAQPSTDVPDVITVGRVSVDLYAQEVHAAFTDPQTFRKSIGGSPTNVAVAAARHGHHAAVVTKVGTDAQATTSSRSRTSGEWIPGTSAATLRLSLRRARRPGATRRATDHLLLGQAARHDGHPG